MSHKIIKFIFKLLFSGLNAVQSLFIFSSFLILVYFFVSLSTLKIPVVISSLFEALYKFQYDFFRIPNFYDVDYTYMLLAVECLLIVFILIHVLNYIIYLEGIYDNINAYRKEKYEKNFNLNLIKKTVNEKIDGFYLMFSLNLEVISESKFLADTKPSINLDKLYIKIKNFIEGKLKNNFNVDCKIYNKNFMFYFKNFNDCNKVFDDVYSCIRKVKSELKNIKVKFYAKCSVCVKGFSYNSDCSLLEQMININKNDRIVTNNDFKMKYDTLNSQKYKYLEIGEYSFSDNIYCLYGFEPNFDLE